MNRYLWMMLIAMFASCTTGSKSVISTPGQFALQLDEKASYGNMEFTLKEVKESRCPMNARCIRAGEAVAVLNVVIDNKAERNVQLCTGADCQTRALSEQYNLSTGDQKYLFKLDSITPDPTKTLEKAEKKVYFSISESK